MRIICSRSNVLLPFRIEFDAYRMDLENTKPELTPSAVALEETQRSYAQHKEQYEKLRSDVAVKMQFLDENRVSGAKWI